MLVNVTPEPAREGEIGGQQREFRSKLWSMGGNFRGPTYFLIMWISVPFLRNFTSSMSWLIRKIPRP